MKEFLEGMLEEGVKVAISASILMVLGAAISSLYPVGFVQATIFAGVICIMADTMFDE
jgi:hypothetical protein